VDDLAPREVEIPQKVSWAVHAKLAAAQRTDRGRVTTAGSRSVDIAADYPRTRSIVELTATIAAAKAGEIPHDDPLPILGPVNGQRVYERKGACLAHGARHPLNGSQGSLQLAALDPVPEFLFPF